VLALRLPQVKQPCAAAAQRSYVQDSPSANYFGKPDKSIRLRATQGVEDCKAQCDRRSQRLGRSATVGCVAFSVGTGGAASRVTGRAGPRYCNLYSAEVPFRLCTAEDTESPCTQVSEGSYRVVYA
jgi:hypothetical protein